MDFCVRRSGATDDFLERLDRLFVCLLDQQPLGVHAHVTIWIFKSLRQIADGCFREIWHLELFGFLVLHAPNAAKIMVAIGTNGSVHIVMAWTTRVVVDHGLVVEVENVKGGIPGDSRLHG